jgi:hypothetical protein
VIAAAAAPGDVGSPVPLPEVRRYDVTGSRGIVHVDPVGPTTIVDGDAQSVADLAAFGALPAKHPVLYAADLTAPEIRRQASAGAELVIGDSNRRRQFLPQSTQQNRGATLAATDPLPAGAASIDPFAGGAPERQTVSVLQGARYLTAPRLAGELQFPEHAPIAAFDGDPSTSWVADRYLPVSDRWIEVAFERPRDVPYVEVLPQSDSHGVVTEVDVNGVRRHVGAGVTRIPVALDAVSRLRVTIDHVVQPRTGLGGPGGFREIRIPGLHVHALLRAPLVLGRALAGADLRRDGLTYLFERTTGDDPFRRNPFGTTTVLNDARDRDDPEQLIDRAVFVPAPRSFGLDAWIHPAVGTPDSTLDRMAGYRGPERFDSSTRFQDQAAWRASSAFAPGTGARPGWVGVWAVPEAPYPWISWRGARPLSLRGMRLVASSLDVRRPKVVQVSWPGGASRPVAVGADGVVALPRPVRARSFRITVLAASFPAGTPVAARQAKAVGIGAVIVPGLRPVQIASGGPLRAGCGSAAIVLDGRRVPLEPVGTVAQLDSGEPLRARGCGPAAVNGAPLRAGIARIRALSGPFDIDLLRLRSARPLGPAAGAGRAGVAATGRGGRVIDPGVIGQSSVTGVRVALTAPSWLVLGESFNAGWRATCDGRSLGAPRVLDAYANGWLAPASCRKVAFSFAPQSPVRTSYLFSAVACALLLLFLVAGALRAPAPAPSRAADLPAEPPGRRLPLPRAAALALPAAVAIGYVFAIRAGAVALPLLALLLWRGWGPRTLTLIAAGLLGIAVPLIYLLVSPDDRGGYNFDYSVELINAHWVGVAAIVLLAIAAWRVTRQARTR